MIPGGAEAELEPVVVREAYRGMGIGRGWRNGSWRRHGARGVGQLKVRPVVRNKRAIRFFHEMGFDILGQIGLCMDFGAEEGLVWRLGERMAGREFRV